ncbi:hypothetical protein CDAR_540381 [Caerostris darwini]|uniref:Uncharacterized protein n=1 Tax=Caerostris darwini TaxID=1538125 RepID=A0AAV4WTG0_9ARAC|nr:hypothetical protein CDAR_540381 [Caerostris darwini]
MLRWERTRRGSGTHATVALSGIGPIELLHLCNIYGPHELIPGGRTLVRVSRLTFLKQDGTCLFCGVCFREVCGQMGFGASFKRRCYFLSTAGMDVLGVR